MNYYTIDYDVNRPMANQITVPMNSEYGIGVRVIRDNEPVNLEMGELSVNGISATSQVNGYNLYELSSGNGTGMNLIDVDVQSGIYGQVTNVAERINARPSVSTLAIAVVLSSFISEPTYFKSTDIRWTELLSRSASSSGEYPDNWNKFASQYGGVNQVITVYPTKGGIISYGYQEDYPNYAVVGEQYRNKWAVFNPATGEPQPSEKILLYPDGYVYNQLTVVPRTKAQIKYTFTVDTHGVKGKFPLQVNVADKGYFERRLENEQTII